jgi:hypothetical protein
MPAKSLSLFIQYAFYIKHFFYQVEVILTKYDFAVSIFL